MNRKMIQAEVYTLDERDTGRYFVYATAISIEQGEQSTQHFKFEAGQSSYPTLYGAIVAGVCQEFIKQVYHDEMQVSKRDEVVDSMNISINFNRVDMDTLKALFD